jgi:hypothetical protein
MAPFFYRIYNAQWSRGPSETNLFVARCLLNRPPPPLSSWDVSIGPTRPISAVSLIGSASLFYTSRHTVHGASQGVRRAWGKISSIGHSYIFLHMDGSIFLRIYSAQWPRAPSETHLAVAGCVVNRLPLSWSASIGSMTRRP